MSPTSDQTFVGEYGWSPEHWRTWCAAAIRAHLTRHGLRPSEVREVYGAEGFGPSIYVDDPEGNTVELKGPAESRVS